eukprot:gene6949-10688_t
MDAVEEDLARAVRAKAKLAAVEAEEKRLRAEIGCRASALEARKRQRRSVASLATFSAVQAPDPGTDLMLFAKHVRETAAAMEVKMGELEESVHKKCLLLERRCLNVFEAMNRHLQLSRKRQQTLPVIVPSVPRLAP